MVDENIDLGTCCVCEGTEGVENIIMLPHVSPTPGTGWGCLVCGLPSSGASAVVCNECFPRMNIETDIKYVFTGYPLDKGRTPFSEVASTRFNHDLSKHPAEVRRPILVGKITHLDEERYDPDEG